MASDSSRLHKRCTWLNANVFTESPIEKEVIDSLQSVDLKRAFEILKEMEEKGEEVKNPTGFLKKAIFRELGLAINDGVQKRVRWINYNVYKRSAIDDEAVAALSAIDWGRAMEMCKELEEKGDDVKNPSKYVKAACARELTPSSNQGIAAEHVMTNLASGKADDKVHRRCTWMNNNVLQGKEISQENIVAMSMLGVQAAMALCEDIEGKADKIGNTNGYIQTAVKRAVGGNGVQIMHTQVVPGVVQSGPGDFSRVKKRCTWLSSNVFTNGGIDDEAVAALASLGFQRAMEICKELEQKGDQVANPSGYIKAAVRREGQSWQGGPSKRVKKF